MRSHNQTLLTGPSLCKSLRDVRKGEGAEEGRMRADARHECSTSPSFREKCGIQITPQILSAPGAVTECSERAGIRE